MEQGTFAFYSVCAHLGLSQYHGGREDDESCLSWEETSREHNENATPQSPRVARGRPVICYTRPSPTMVLIVHPVIHYSRMEEPSRTPQMPPRSPI